MLPKSCRWPSVVEFGNCFILWLWGISDTQTTPPPTGAGREPRRKERWLLHRQTPAPLCARDCPQQLAQQPGASCFWLTLSWGLMRGPLPETGHLRCLPPQERRLQRGLPGEGTV